MVGIVQEVKLSEAHATWARRGHTPGIRAQNTACAENGALVRESRALGGFWRGNLREEAVKYSQVVDLARLAGFEPTTPAFGGQYSIQLSYRRVDLFPLRFSAR